jgi:hypothetical protein
MISFTPRNQQRGREQLDAEVDTSRRELRAELGRVKRLIPRGGRIALFAPETPEQHEVAIVRGLRPAPEDGILLVHNHLTGDSKPQSLTRTLAWLVTQTGIAYARDATWQSKTGEWHIPQGAPQIMVHGNTHLRLSVKYNVFQSDEGVPIEDTAHYSKNVYGLVHCNTPDQATMLAAGVHALQLCTASTLDRGVTQYIPHFPTVLD